MSFYRRDTQLAPMPFTGMLRAVDIEAARHEASVLCAAKLNFEKPEAAAHQARALRAVERILVGVERFWDSAPPAAMSIKEMIGRFEAMKASTTAFTDPQRKAQLRDVQASSTLEGDDD